MTPTWSVIEGDCVEAMAAMGEASVDAVVTDPPYNLTFMGKPWDCHDGQEDAGFAYWLAGLIDGEGHFAIKAHTRGSHAPCFTMKMRADEEGTLRLIERTLRIGTISTEKRDPNPLVKWTVQDKAGCQRLVDLLDKYPLRAKKRLDYATWREAVCEWTSRSRGNRWHGAADNTRMADLRERLMGNRRYVEPAWSGHEFQDWCRLWAHEALRVLKPGGHLLAMGGTRTYHRLTAGLEDAGFEIRDCISYLYGSGFPKSLNLDGDRKGWGTALKPAHEPIVVARKPLAGTVAENCLEYGTGALNVDGCRIEGQADVPFGQRRNPVERTGYGSYAHDGGEGCDGTDWKPAPGGRWPANVALDEHVARMLDEQTGDLHPPGSFSRPESYSASSYEAPGGTPLQPSFTDRGGASRFFYCAKASRAERNAGLDGMPEQQGGDYAQGSGLSGRTQLPSGEWVNTENPRRARANAHPTVKPVALMRWLVRLVTPPGGSVLDPFCGSGSTGMAAVAEGFEFVGVERDPDYVKIAQARIRWWADRSWLANRRGLSKGSVGRVAGSNQMSLLGDDE